MILGVMSDTHGPRPLMFRTAERMIGAHGASVIFHLGDNYADGEALMQAGYTVRVVPGLMCAQYYDPKVPHALLEEFEGWRIAAVHSEETLEPRQRNVDIILSGHTHRAAIRRAGRCLYVNPGHAKSAVDRGERASYAIIDLTPERLTATIHETDGCVRTACTFKRCSGDEKAAPDS